MQSRKACIRTELKLWASKPVIKDSAEMGIAYKIWALWIVWRDVRPSMVALLEVREAGDKELGDELESLPTTAKR